MKSILHVGCGSDSLPNWLQGFNETRLDIDERVNPDIVASMTDIGDIGQFDAVLCVHALEHLHQHEVGTALSEFMRVLKPGGHAIVFVPDLEDVRPTEDVLYTSSAGEVTGLDLIYGMRSAISEFPHMAHKTGFTSATLEQAITAAGFKSATVKRLDNYNMMGVGIK